MPTFSGRILAIDIDTDVAQCCAMLYVPDPRSDRDALIGATAFVHGLTCNRERCRLRWYGSRCAQSLGALKPFSGINVTLSTSRRGQSYLPLLA